MGINTIPHFNPGDFSIGFDTILENMSNWADASTKNSGYPPHNIRKANESQYKIELAVAGFDEEDIELEFNAGRLNVSGTRNTESNTDDLLYNGIANRSFKKTFNLSDDVEVKTAGLKNGILTVDLEKHLPDYKKKRTIPINEKEVSKKQLLTEEE
jgi:molecular chaperone IbpA